MSDSPQPPVFGMRLDEILMHVWFDGFTSGAASGCGLFLPGGAADMKADELAAEAIESPELRAQVQASARDRMRELMEHVMAGSGVVTVCRMVTGGTELAMTLGRGLGRGPMGAGMAASSPATSDRARRRATRP